MQQTPTIDLDVLADDFDPWNPSFIGDPYAVYRAMRTQDPVHWNRRRGLWFLTRYDDVMPALKDHKRLSTAVFHIEKPHMEQRPADGKRYQAFKGPTMVTTEPPEQSRLRRGAAPAFSARAMERLGHRLEQIADELLDELVPRGSADILADFAYPFPIRAIAELLGIPADEQATFLALATGEKGSPGHDPRATKEALERAEQHGQQLRALVERVIARKRVEPGEDLISTMIAHEQDAKITLSEMTDTVHLMMEAGHITTVNLIGNGLDVLLDRPETLDRMRRDPELIPAAVEECLRYVGPVQFTGRTALEDLEIDGHKIAAGECLITLLPAANRDPAAFGDPETFDIDRPRHRNLALGIGAHVCIGAALARIETQIAFRKILERLPQLERNGESDWGSSFELRGRTALPVRF